MNRQIVTRHVPGTLEVEPHEHDGSEVSGEMTLVTLRVTSLLGGTITGKVITVSGAAGVIQSDDYVAGTSGWAIFGDGSAEFNNVVVRGDIESGNWDGTSPANLATIDAGATVGFYLDSSTGAAQFMGDIFLGGNLQVSDDTDIVFGADADATIGFLSGTSALQVSADSLLSLVGGVNLSMSAAALVDLIGANGSVRMSSALDLEVGGTDQLEVNMDADSLAVVVATAEVARITSLGVKGIEVADDSEANGRTFTNTSYLDLDALTGGAGTITAVSASVVTGTRALVMFSAEVGNDTVGQGTKISYKISGATTVAADDTWYAFHNTATGAGESVVGRSLVHGGLTPGTNVFEVQAKVSANTGTISKVYLVVIPL